MLGRMEGVVDPILRTFSLSRQSQRVLPCTYPGLLGGSKDEGKDEAGTVTDSMAPLGRVSSHGKRR